MKHTHGDNTQLNETIQQLRKELDDLSYSISHDLRAPLRAINGYVQILQEDHEPSLNDEARRLLSVVAHNAAKMGQLIDNVLSLSRISRKELRKSSVDLNELVEGALIDLGKEKPHHAEIHIDRLPMLLCDYGLMNEALVQLIGNAIKYSSKKEKPVIHISASVTGGVMVFSIQDNGVGFDTAYADKLFGVFQRLHSGDDFEGAGTGLAIVQRIISRHGGRVWADAKPNEGAAFYFSIPVTVE